MELETERPYLDHHCSFYISVHLATVSRFTYNCSTDFVAFLLAGSFCILLKTWTTLVKQINDSNVDPKFCIAAIVEPDQFINRF
jgi:hypothetical protein